MNKPQFLKAGYHRKPRFWLAVLMIVIVIFLLRNCSGFSHNKHPEQSVVVAPVISRDIPIYLSALGAVTPIDNVIVKTQVNGQLLQVLFREGQTVKAGDLLAKVDSRPYQAQLVQYQGQLARDKALLANAQLDLKRYQLLWRQDSVSKQTRDTQDALVKQYEGAIKVDEGLIENTTINLGFTQIASPIDGRVGLRLVDPGNIVQTSDTTGLAVITMLNPITVIFSVPEDNITEIMKQINAGKTLTAEAYNRDQSQLLATGTLLTMDNQIDPTTGTVKLRAQFKNDKNLLFPNQFVNVKLLVETLQHATVIPTAAIQYGTQGTFVFAVNKDQTVSIKPIVIGVASDNDTAVMSGLSPGESVVVEGANKLTDGAAITIPGIEPAEASPKKNHHKRAAA